LSEGVEGLDPSTEGNAVKNADADVGEGGLVESSGEEARTVLLLSDLESEVRSRL
jgi:hypothetical protein